MLKQSSVCACVCLYCMCALLPHLLCLGVCDVVEERGLMLGAAVELIRGVPGERGRCSPPISQRSSPGRRTAWLGP